jgi:NADPH:quinone reductase-like Zn-dependent oxidoreductase
MTPMKAIRIHGYGDASVLRLEDDVPRPEPKEGEVLVRVLAAGVNPIDWKARAGYLEKMVPLPLPWIPGGDFSGIVEDAGDEVYGRADLPRDGTYAEYVVVPRAAIARKPETVDHVHAAAVPLAALTAWQGLFGPGSIELGAGQTLLMIGASGGVGSFAVQLAKAKGARVIAAVRTGHDVVKWLGADEVLDTANLGDSPDVDAILDVVGGKVGESAWPRLKQGGAFASTVGKPSEAEAAVRGARAIGVYTQTNAAQLEEIGKLIDLGSVQVPVDRILPLAAAAEAHQLLENGGVHGKIVLTVAQSTVEGAAGSGPH